MGVNDMTPKACSTVFTKAFSGLRATGMTFNCVISDVFGC
jgi:hypothetical protein